MSPEAQAAFHRHAADSHPRECCGVLAGGRYHPCENVSASPDTFEISGTELLRVERESGPIQAVLHSHCFSGVPDRVRPEWPSHEDMVSWLRGSRPWGIVATDGQYCTQTVWLDDSERPPLAGRQFQFGAQDCYSLVRDFFHDRGIELPNRPRAWRWEERGGPGIVGQYAEMGFARLPKAEARVGDVLVYCHNSAVPNHLAVLTGPNTILQQMVMQPSGYAARSDYRMQEQFALRHEDVQLFADIGARKFVPVTAEEAFGHIEGGAE